MSKIRGSGAVPISEWSCLETVQTYALTAVESETYLAQKVRSFCVSTDFMRVANGGDSKIQVMPSLVKTTPISQERTATDAAIW